MSVTGTVRPREEKGLRLLLEEPITGRPSGTGTFLFLLPGVVLDPVSSIGVTELRYAVSVAVAEGTPKQGEERVVLATGGRKGMPSVTLRLQGADLGGTSTVFCTA